MIKSVTYPNNECFTGNPVIVKVITDSPDDIVLTITVSNNKLSLTATPLMSNSNGEVNFSIGDILETYFGKTTDLIGYIVRPLHYFSLSYTIKIDGSDTEFTGLAYRGGISGLNYTYLKSKGLDMFKYRLNSAEPRQFLFTTRTNSDNLIIKERELHRYVFISSGQSLTFITPNANKLTLTSANSAGTYTLDLNELRYHFFYHYNELPSFIAVQVGGKTCFTITITPSPITDNFVLLRFRNSLGAFELIELTGSALSISTFSEENIWKTPHPDGYYTESRQRLTTKDSIKIHTGYKTKEELIFLKDLLKSDEIYYIKSLSDLDGGIKCLLNGEKFEYTEQNKVPESILLNIRFVTEEMFESPEIIETEPIKIFTNLTAPGKPEINAEGFVIDDDKTLYAE